MDALNNIATVILAIVSLLFGIIAFLIDVPIKLVMFCITMIFIVLAIIVYPLFKGKNTPMPLIKFLSYGLEWVGLKHYFLTNKVIKLWNC